MAKLACTINSVPTEKSLATLEFWKNLTVIANPGSKTVVNAVNGALARSKGYIEAFGKAGNPGDVIVILEDEKPAASYTRKQMARKMEVARDVSQWLGEIFTEKGEKVSTDKGELEV